MAQTSPISRKELQALAMARLAEANALVAAGLYSGGYYLSGYVIELGLKAKFAKAIRAETVPSQDLNKEFYHHNLVLLCTAADLDAERKSHEKNDPVFGTNWVIVTKWSEASRYREWKETDARSMLAAVADPRSGVFPWIQTYW